QSRARPIQWRAIPAATAGAQAEGIAGLDLGHQHLGIRKFGLPVGSEAERHRIALAVATTLKPPGTAVGALDLGIECDIGARPYHPLHPEAAAIAAGAAGVRHQRVALDHERKFRLDLLVR